VLQPVFAGRAFPQELYNQHTYVSKVATFVFCYQGGRPADLDPKALAGGQGIRDWPRAAMSFG
jgi:hypothetical protein